MIANTTGCACHASRIERSAVPLQAGRMLANISGGLPAMLRAPGAWSGVRRVSDANRMSANTPRVRVVL
jgi:hypothetical protein